MRHQEKVPSGIPGFDEVSKGGIPRGRTTLISGTTGAGKTIFGSQFLYTGIKNSNDNGVFVTFEESPEDIRNNCAGFDWDVAELEKKGRWAFVDFSVQNSSFEVKTGPYDLDGLITRIEHAVKKVKAKRLVIDSISALFPRHDDKNMVRATLHMLGLKMKALKVTSLLTGERPEEQGMVTRFGVEEFVSDNVILLHNRLIPSGERERTIEVLKFRGTDHEKNEAPLLVGKEGMCVFPRPKPELKGKAFTQKLKIGIAGLDDILHGGVYKNSTTLLTGASGTGKTTSVLHFMMEGARKGEQCLLMEFEESKDQLLRNARSFGWDMAKHVKNGTIQLVCHYPEDLKGEQYLKIIQDTVLQLKPKRFALDSLSALERIYDKRKFREFVIGLNAFLKMHDVTSFLAHTTNEMLGFSSITESHLSTATDNIIVLKYVEVESAMGRVLSVLKARGSTHKKGLAKFEITKNGFEVAGFYENVQGLLTGSASYIKPPVDVADLMSKIDGLRRDFVDKRISKKKYDAEVKKIKKEIEDIQRRGV